MKKILATFLLIFSLPVYSEIDVNAIYQPILNNDKTTVNKLLSQGINPNSNFPSGWSLLYGATINGNTEIAEALIKHGAKGGNNELEAAITNQHTDIVSLILKSGVNPNYFTKEGATPLMLAAYWGNSEIIKLLVKYNAKIDTKNTKGKTALNIAEERKQQYNNVIRMLTKKP